VKINGGSGLRKNCIVLILSLMLMSISPAFAQASFASSGNETANDTADNTMENNATANVAVSIPSDTAVSTEPLHLQGIWKLSLAGSEIIMAVNQSGDSLFGQAKFEGTDPWNGVIAGSLSGRAVHIALAALQGKVLVSTLMSGTALDDSIEGSYVRSDSDGNAAKGEFTAIKISPDAAGYSPAKIEATPEVAPAEQIKEQAQPEAESDVGSYAQPAVQTKGRSFKDVRELAKGIDPNIMPRHAPL
jgi:hypothetical protein